MSTTDPDEARPAERGAEVASFVLRFSQDLWREEGGEPRVRWRGHIRHAQSDAEARFTDFADAVGFMQRQLAERTLESVAGDDAPSQARALSDSFQLWERVATGYRDLWLQAIQASADRTKQVGQQLERAWPWWPFWPTGGAQAGAPAPDVAESLEGIRRALERLGDRLDALEQGRAEEG
jgi:hypothetical protein